MEEEEALVEPHTSPARAQGSLCFCGAHAVAQAAAAAVALLLSDRDERVGPAEPLGFAPSLGATGSASCKCEPLARGE